MNKTEVEYLELATDCKNRIMEKNKEIKKLKNELKSLKHTIKIMNRNILKAHHLIDIHSKFNVIGELHELIKNVDLDFYFMSEIESDDSYDSDDILTEQFIDEMELGLGND
tara:strand:+ start:859 stop:1191 length:333 start_codon:yes stop_codon:yes gene_type:complete